MRGRWAVHLSVVRLQSAGVCSGLVFNRSTLGARRSVDAYSWATLLYSGSSCSSSRRNKDTLYQDRLTLLAHLPRLFATEPEVNSLRSDARVLRAVQRTQRVSWRRQTTKSADGIVVYSTLCAPMHLLFRHIYEDCFELPSAHVKLR